MRTAVVFNAQAGTAGRIKDVLSRFSGRAEYDLWTTEAAGDAHRLASRAVESGVDRLVVAGGDGTIGQVVDGMAPHFDAFELAVLPLGTGNDLARSLGLGADQLETAAQHAFEGSTTKLDVIRFRHNDHVGYMINAATGGFGGKVAADVQAADKQRWGPFAYWLTAVSHLTRLEEFHITLTLDEQTIEESTYGLAVANGRFVGGGFPIAPSAALNDGLLDVTVIPVLPTLELLAAGLNFSLSTTMQKGRLQTFQARRAHVHAEPDMPFSIDGEPTRSMDAEFEVLPSAVAFVTGPNPVALVASSDIGK